MELGRHWIPLLALGCSTVGCRFGYEELSFVGAGAGGAPSGFGGSSAARTSAGGDAGDWGAAGEAPATGGTGGSTGGAAGTGGSLSGGASGGGAGGAGGVSPGGGNAGVSGGGEANAGSGGGAASGDGGTGAGGGGNGGAAATGGAGGIGTPPDGTLCNQSTYGGHDYLLCRELRTWFDAHGGCAAVGMRLVRVDDANENEWLYENANVPVGRDSQIWLGATDQALEGEWRWTDGELFWLGDSLGSAQNGLFDAWSSREPNDVGGEEECASLETNSASPEWFDSVCLLAMPYVCEST